MTEQSILQFAPELYLVLTLFCVFVIQFVKRDEQHRLLRLTVLMGMASALLASFFPMDDITGVPSVGKILFRDDYSQIWRILTLLLGLLQLCLFFKEDGRRRFEEIILVLGVSLVLLLFTSSQQFLLSVLLFVLFGLLIHRVLFQTENSKTGMDASLRFLFHFSMWTFCLFGGIVVFSAYMKLPALELSLFSGSDTAHRALLFFLTAPILGCLSVMPLLSWSPYVNNRISALWTPFVWIAIRILSFSWVTRNLEIFKKAADGRWGDALDVWAVSLKVLIILNAAIAMGKVFRARSLKMLLSATALSQVSYYLASWVLLTERSLAITTTELIFEVFIVYGLYLSVLGLEKLLGGDGFNRIKGLFHRSPYHAVFFSFFLMNWMSLPLLGSINGKVFLTMEALREGHFVFGSVLAISFFVNAYSVFRLLISMMTPSSEVVSESVMIGTWDRAFHLALTVPIFLGMIFYERFFQVSMQSVQLIFR